MNWACDKKKRRCALTMQRDTPKNFSIFFYLSVTCSVGKLCGRIEALYCWTLGWRNIILQSRPFVCVCVCYRIMTGQVNPRSLPLLPPQQLLLSGSLSGAYRALGGIAPARRCCVQGIVKSWPPRFIDPLPRFIYIVLRPFDVDISLL